MKGSTLLLMGIVMAAIGFETTLTIEVFNHWLIPGPGGSLFSLLIWNRNNSSFELNVAGLVSLISTCIIASSIVGVWSLRSGKRWTWGGFSVAFFGVFIGLVVVIHTVQDLIRRFNSGPHVL